MAPIVLAGLACACEHPGAAAPALSPSPASHARAAAVAVSADPHSAWAASSALAERVGGWELPQVVRAASASPDTPVAGADSLGKIGAEDLSAAARALARRTQAAVRAP